MYNDPGKAMLGNKGRPRAERGTESRRKFEDIIIGQCPRESENKIRGELGAPPPTEESDQRVVIAEGLMDGRLKEVDNSCGISLRSLEGTCRGGSCDSVVGGDYRHGPRFSAALVRFGVAGSVGVGLANWDDLAGIGVFGSEAHVHVDKHCF